MGFLIHAAADQEINMATCLDKQETQMGRLINRPVQMFKTLGKEEIVTEERLTSEEKGGECPVGVAHQKTKK